MMSDKTTLTSKVITELKEKANQCRKNWGVFPDVPVGNDLFKLLEEKEKIKNLREDDNPIIVCYKLK